MSDEVTRQLSGHHEFFTSYPFFRTTDAAAIDDCTSERGTISKK